MPDMLARYRLIVAHGYYRRESMVVVHLQAERLVRMDESCIVVSLVKPDGTVLPGLGHSEHCADAEAARQAWAGMVEKLRAAGFRRVE